MNLRRFVVAAAVLLAAPLQAGAQSPLPAASSASPAAVQSVTPQVPAFSPDQEASVKYYKLMLDMARATQASSFGDKQLLDDKLITIYERLVELYCMPELLRTLQHAPDPTGAECLEYIARLGELHPDNPVLLCAKHGIDSELCKNAYLNQYIDTYKLDDLDPSELDLKTKIKAELSEKDIKQLAADAEAQRHAWENAVTESKGDKAKADAVRKTKKELDSSNTKLLNLACKVVRIKIAHKEIEETKKLAGGKKPEPKGDPLRDLVREFTDISVRGTPKPAADARKPQESDLDYPFASKQDKPRVQKPKAPPLWRVRYLTSECLRQIENVQRYDPQLPAVACNLEGETSPHCIALIREWRRGQQLPTVPQRQKPSGFSTF